MIGGVKSVELVAEPVVGWRSWRIVNMADVYGAAHDYLHEAGVADAWTLDESKVQTGVRLRSTTNNTAWTLPLRAWCSVHDTEAPVEDCGCGVYAYKWKGGTDDQMVQHLYEAYPFAALHGKVELWGRIVEHEDGYRAEYARPAGLFAPVPRPASSPSPGALAEIIRYYGVRLRTVRVATGSTRCSTRCSCCASSG